MLAPRPGRRQPGMNQPSQTTTDATRRRNARRTALALGLVAAARMKNPARLIALETRIAQLNRTRDALQRLVAECSSGKSGPCPILQSFGL